MIRLVYWISRNDRHVFISLLTLTTVARFITFFNPVIDHDEITYAVIADHILQGSVLYKDVIDIKQPGIFIIFGLVQLIFGKSMLAVRLVTSLTIAGASFLLYSTKRKLEFGFSSSYLSALAFMLMFNFYFGFATNTEVFFVFCSAFGLYLFCSSSRWYTYLLSGLLYGVGFIIKQHIAFDFAAVAIFFFGWSIYKKDFKENFGSMMLMVIGFLVTPTLVHLAFWYSGYYEYYHFISFVAPGNYSDGNDLMSSLAFLGKATTVYLPFILAALIGVKSLSWQNGIGWYILLWMLMVGIAVTITGRTFPHYYLQLALPISFAAGEIASLAQVRTFFNKKMVSSIGRGVLAVYLVFLSQFYYKRYIIRPNKPVDLAEFLEDKVTDDMSIYTGDGPPYLYWYFDKLSPTPYIHSTLLAKQSNIHTLDIDLSSELDSIYQSQPDIVILSENYPYQSFRQKVLKEYEEIGQVHQFKVYQR